MVWDNLSDFNPMMVFKDGALISESGSPVQIAPRTENIRRGGKIHRRLPHLTAADFALKAEKAFPVVEIIPMKLRRKAGDGPARR